MNNSLEFNSECIIKKYNPNDEHFLMSSVDNEIFCINKFFDNGRNPYCPIVMRIDELSYVIQRYSFELGDAISINHNSVKKMFFSITFDELKKQINEILDYLNKVGINHRDFNPSNLIFYEKERRIKLIDFYWAKTNGIEVGTPGQLNWFYGKDDRIAADKILEQIKVIYNSLSEQCEKEVIPLTNDIGKEYFDGSSTSKMFLYHKVDIPMIKTLYVVDPSDQIDSIISNINISVKSMIDIGCSVGSFTFNLMRNYRLDNAYLYEADPYVNNFLKKIKSVFGLNNLQINNTVTSNIDFPEVDIALMLNIHMWIYKQLGREQTDKITSQIIKKSKITFFQTAGKESPGMSIIEEEEFASKEGIEKYLYSLGSKKVYYIGKIDLHGGFRHLFKIQGR